MPSFLAIIFDPKKERAHGNHLMDQMSALERSTFTYARSIQLPPLEDPNAAQIDPRYPANAVVKPLLFQNLSFKPQANLDIDRDLWQRAVTLPETQRLVEIGALSVVQPEEKLLKNYPEGTQGYKLYSLKDAINLVQSTYSLDSLELWSDGEERAEVKAAIATQKQMINKHSQMLVEGAYER